MVIERNPYKKLNIISAPPSMYCYDNKSNRKQKGHKVIYLMRKVSRKSLYSEYKDHRVEFVRRAGIGARGINNIVERLQWNFKG